MPNFTVILATVSFKDGLAPPSELVDRAVELGQPAFGLTDHGCLFGAPSLFKACKGKPIKGIIGMEVYEAVPHQIDPNLEFADKDSDDYKRSEAYRFKQKYDPLNPRYYHLTLWAMNLKGWENLCALHTLSWDELHKPKNQPLVDRYSLERHSEGIICGLGCPASRVNRSLAEQGYDAAVREAEWYIGVFGDRAYVEVMAVLDDQLAALRSQRKLAKHFGATALGVNDVHYKDRADGVENGAHHILVQARRFGSKATADENDRDSDDKSGVTYGEWYGSDGFFLKDRDEMLQSGLLAPELDATLEVAARVDFDFDEMIKPAKPQALVPELGKDAEFDLWVALS